MLVLRPEAALPALILVRSPLSTASSWTRDLRCIGRSGCIGSPYMDNAVNVCNIAAFVCTSLTPLPADLGEDLDLAADFHAPS